jgi:hypothetical protein
MQRLGTGAQAWALTTGNNSNPSLSQGQATNFFCNTVPDRCQTGPLAYLLPFVILTIYGNVVQAGTAGSVVYTDDLTAALIQSINWITAWHGTPVSSNHVLGSNLPIVEYINGGYRYALRRRPAIAAAAGTYPFQLSVAIPASAARYGHLMRNTSQLAKCFQTSQLQINVAAASVMTALSTGATLTSLTAKCSAILYPTTELVLGTPVENILHQTVAGTNSSEVQIKGFGTSTLLNGVQPKGGVLFLGELTNQGQQNGVFAAENVTQLQFPWRGQQQINHIEALVSPFMQAQGSSRPQTQPGILTGGDSEFAGYPYNMSNSDQMTTAASAAMDLKGLRVFPLVYADDEVSLTDLETADGDASYFLTVSGGFSSGTHQVLAQYAKAWQPSMVNDWQKLITDGDGGSLAAYVLGQNWRQGKIGRRLPFGRYTMTEDQKTYLPYQFTL